MTVSIYAWLVKSLDTEQIIAQGENEPAAFDSVGLCVFFGCAYKRLSRWDSRDEAFLDEPHALIS